MLDSIEAALEPLVTTNPKPAMAIQVSIDKHSKCKWDECTNQMTQSYRMDKKQDLSICCLQETHFKPKDIHRLKLKGWKKIFHPNNREKKSSGSSTCIRQNRLQNKENKKDIT